MLAGQAPWSSIYLHMLAVHRLTMRMRRDRFARARKATGLAKDGIDQEVGHERGHCSGFGVIGNGWITCATSGCDLGQRACLYVCC